MTLQPELRRTATPYLKAIKACFRSILSVCTMLLFASLAIDAIAQDALPVPAVEDFFDNNTFGNAVMSPSGHYLAVRTNPKGRRDVLAVIDIEKKTAKVVAEYSDADIGNFQWVNEDRLVYDTRDTTEASGDHEIGPGLYAVNRDGMKRMQLANRGLYDGAPQPWNTFLIDQRGSQDSDWIYVQRPLYDKVWHKYFGTRLRRLNTVTGVAEIASEPDYEVSRFILDFQGKPRLAISFMDTLTTIYYRDPVTDKWRVLLSYGSYGDARNNVEPLGFGPDGTLYVIANAGQDTSSLRTLDLVTGQVSKDPLVEIPGYDFAGNLVIDTKVRGIRLTTDAEANVWFDPAMQAIQNSVNKALPNTNNLITLPRQPGAPWVLVESYSDVQPPQYTLFEVETGAINLIGSAYPNIKSTSMGRQESLRYRARDGLSISGLLTLPHGAGRKGLPMVVLVHGGPWVRGTSWRWNPQSQFLASRGYAVLELEYRGSAGFGVTHMQAGFKQWGLAMQNDIADGTRWAIAEGIADPQRICIAGASYGGYATLMGLINDPDLYRCGVEWLGVTDIKLMYTGTWYSKSDASDGYLQYGMPLMIGDPITDAAQLKATSPIQQAHRIHQPLLLAYGDEDKRVPIFHGKKFYSAVTETNKDVEWVVYSGEEHGWSLPKNRIDFWRRVEKFLAKNIGKARSDAAEIKK